MGWMSEWMSDGVNAPKVRLELNIGSPSKCIKSVSVN